MRLYEILNEGINDNLLYHGVRNGSIAAKILQTGEIKPNFSTGDKEAVKNGTYKQVHPVVSVTRDPHLHFGEAYRPGVIQFVIDKNALIKAGYKVVPQSGGDMGGSRHEAEERVTHKNNKGIPVKPPFVIEIQVDPDIKVPAGFAKLAQDLGIKISGMRMLPKNKSHHRAGDETSTPVETNNIKDPSKLYITRSYDGYGIAYPLDGNNAGYFDILSGIEDEEAAKKVLEIIKRRMKTGEPLDNIKKLVHSKDWKSGNKLKSYINKNIT